MRAAELTENNLSIYAAKHYCNPRGVDEDEFQEDLARFKFIKRLVVRFYETQRLSERLILNHIIVALNVFGIQATLAILELKIEKKYWPIIKPFLVFLRAIRNDEYTNIPQDQVVVEKLRSIKSA